APYTYGLGNNPISTNNVFNNLSAGNYIIHVLDSNGCNLDTTVSVAQPNNLSSMVSFVQPLCYGDNNGSMTFNVFGGTPNYTYSIGSIPFSTNNIFNGLAAGTYTLHVKDANDCLHDTTVVLGQPDSLNFTVA